MKRLKLLAMNIMVIGALVGCGSKEAVNDDVVATDIAVSEETSTVEETTIQETTIEELTTIEETQVAQTESVEDDVDDVTYNTGIIMTFGIRQEDAAAAAEFLDKISYGKIDASRRVEKGGETRFEITNKDGISYYLVRNEDTVREILNVKGEFIVTITTNDSSSDASTNSGEVVEEPQETTKRYGDILDTPDTDVPDLPWIP